MKATPQANPLSRKIADISSTMRLLILTAILLLLSSAGIAQKNVKLQGKITAAEKGLDPNQPAKADALKLVKLYSKYIGKFPTDSMSAVYAFKRGDMSFRAADYEQALIYLQDVYTIFPKSGKAPVSLFLEAFIQEEHMNNKVKAKALYNKFLHTYPHHKLASDAKSSIEFIDKSDEELLKLLEGK